MVSSIGRVNVHPNAIPVSLACMDKEQLFDHAFWLGIASKQPELSGDPAGAGHMVDRFVGQYLPAALRSSSKQDFDRVWFAFWNYLVAPKTSRKPFGLSSKAADLLITEFQAALSGPEDEWQEPGPRPSN